MLERFRPLLKKILEPFAKRININPNILTLISPLIAIISAIFFGTGNLLMGGIFILISGVFDVFDGAIARYHNKTSDFGAFLDSTMDRFSDAIIIIGIIWGGYTPWLLGILAIHSAITVSYVRARAEAKGIECNVGIAERATRLIILMVGAFIAWIFGSIFMNWTIIILIILSYITVAQRIYHVWKKTSYERIGL
ncbi:archaetidylinositol phosphate synthase [Methanobrevibacter arboriphilus JCM 13429 = DSM 1125]|uniref:Archaetidylinositol phosphate synthase n=1 Tax=Methanobrevibacter arboriphilus JCM 13429 = DSM 1125 TaxID=1300164 RepID=A0A1V6N4Y7_METAZ|nr:archaetidylinositol phosphate synthase [Methanobrevibacter arboriphilus]OQD59682.1 archaetidylinositol phosphate synthase [Methanobrevibacter arboriphilus JCM 13429 = DSM 1125]